MAATTKDPWRELELIGLMKQVRPLITGAASMHAVQCSVVQWGD